MSTKIPKRLRQEPLIEAIWQVQFDPPGGQSIGEILPGVLFSTLRFEQAGLKLVRLPAAEIPPFVAQNDPNLRFAARFRIEAPDWPFLVQTGDRVVTVNCRAPYVGWEKFKERVISLINILDDTGLIANPQRHSLRYIDLMTLEPPPTVGSLQLALQIGDHAIEKHPLQLRVEVPDEQCTHVLQFVTPAQVRLPEGERAGTLIDLETVANTTGGNWSTIRESLEALHGASKAIFFEKVLTKEAIEKMEPEY
jgi:uncharacterized protein (TIGR04255 family)